MADLTITASQVLESTGPEYVTGTAGEALTAGQPVYLKDSDSRYYRADANASSETAEAVAIMLHGADAGQPIKAQSGGTITLGAGAAPAVGTIYIVSATAGGIAPSADAATGWFITVLGVGAAANTLKLKIFISGQQKP